MVGKVLDYEAKRIYNQGRKEGEEKGWKKGQKHGQKQGQMETLLAMIRINRLTLQEAAEIVGVTEEVFRERGKAMKETSKDLK